MGETELLRVRDLRVSFFTQDGEVRAVRGISYDLGRGEIMGIVGESGSGKSVQAYTLLGLLPPPGRVTGGSVRFEGEDVLALDGPGLREHRGGRVSMIFQNPMTSLNPVYTVGNQLIEALRAHDRTVSRADAGRRAEALLRAVGIPHAEQRMKQYPYECSGGMCQRVMIAMGLMGSPRLLIADEPTTALDVTIQAQILGLLREIRNKTGMSILLITHNLGVVAEVCDRVSVMYAGKIVEQGPVDEIFYRPGHPYTVGLLRSVPRIDARADARLVPIEGAPADLLHPPAGCPFAPRCGGCMKLCLQRMPPFVELGGEHRAACWLRVRDRLADAKAPGRHVPEVCLP